MWKGTSARTPRLWKACWPTRMIRGAYFSSGGKAPEEGELAEYLEETQGIQLDPESIFDIQIKRLHEYKRQQMNVLAVIARYLEIKRGKKPSRPVTVIFGPRRLRPMPLPRISSM